MEAIQECVSMLVLHPDVHFLQFVDQLLGRIDCICEKKIKITSVVSLSLVDLLSLEVSGGTFLQKVCDLNTFSTASPWSHSYFQPDTGKVKPPTKKESTVFFPHIQMLTTFYLNQRKSMTLLNTFYTFLQALSIFIFYFYFLNIFSSFE